MTRRLSDGWTLTDGVMEPFLLARPMEVSAALRAQGALPHRAGGSELIRQEWVRLRTFTYACRFDAPEEDDELYSLLVPLLAGAGSIRLNGRDLGRFDGECAWCPVPGNLDERDNLLEIAFDPDLSGRPRGLISDAFLRAGNYLMLRSARFDGRGESIAARTSVWALTSGKYLFKYAVALDGRPPAHFEFVERLRAMQPDARIEHRLNLPGATAWDPANPDGTGYTVKLNIERMGVGCEQVVAQVAMLPVGYAPTRIVRLHPALLSPGDGRERALNCARELGAEAVAIGGDRPAPREGRPPEWTRPFLEDLLPYGLLVLDATDAAALPVPWALAPLDELSALGGDWAFWPTDGPLYRLFGIEPIDVAEYEARFGVNATGDAGRCARLSRTLQAERLYRSACEARLAGRAMLLDQPIEWSPRPASAALVEAGGAQRPACQAIEEAWSKQVAYARLPESMAAPCGAGIEIPIYLMQDAPGRAVNVSVSAFGQDGRSRLASETFECPPGGGAQVGRLALRMPDAPQALGVRCEIHAAGALLWRHDSVLCAHGEGQPPMAALMAL